MGTGRSPSRLRSKTTDLSDFIRGNAAKQAADAAAIPPVPPVPPIPPSGEIPVPKTKRKLTGFLGLKRKSTGLSLGLDPGTRELKDGIWRSEDPSPAVPDSLLNR